MPELDDQERRDRVDAANDRADAAARLVREDMDDITGPPFALEPGMLDIEQAAAIMPWLDAWMDGRPVYAWEPASRGGGLWRRVRESFPLQLPPTWFTSDSEQLPPTSTAP